MSENRNDVDCPDNPGTGEVYHCKSLDCPAHGDRNRSELIRLRDAMVFVDRYGGGPGKSPERYQAGTYKKLCKAYAEINDMGSNRTQEEKVLAGIEAAVKPNSWKLGCKTRGDSEWSYNALRFPNREACLKYGSDLYSRWTALDTYEAHPSDDVPNVPG